MSEDPPGWLTETSLSSRRSLLTGLAFVLATLLFAAGAEYLIPKIPNRLNLAFGQNVVQLQAGLSVFFAWDLAAILSMLIYFVFYWVRMFGKEGPMKEGGNVVPSIGRAIGSLFVGLLCLLFAFVAGIAFAISIPYSMPSQLVLLTLSAYLFWYADWIVMRKHPDRKIEIEFKLFVEFVDLPMAICFTVLTGFYFVYVTPHDIQQFSAFMSGAIAFQIIAFNVAFAFLLRFTEVISRGKTTILLTSNGQFARDYPDFKKSWWTWWNKPSTPPQLPVGTAALESPPGH